MNCPNCGAVLDPGVLSMHSHIAVGSIKCGGCGHVFSADALRGQKTQRSKPAAVTPVKEKTGVALWFTLWKLKWQLKLGNKSRRERATSELGNLRNTKAVDVLANALKDSDWYVRCRAADALGKINDERAIEPLIGALEDSHESVIERAVKALEALKFEPMDTAQRVFMLAVAQKWGDITQLGSSAVLPLVTILNSYSRPHSVHHLCERAATALGSIGDERAAEPLIAALKASNPRVRLRAAQALGKMREARAVEPLAALLNDSEEFVSEAAKKALEEINGRHRLARPNN